MSNSIKELVKEANTQITTYDAGDAVQRVKNEGAVFVDVREEDELKSVGTIPASQTSILTFSWASL